MLIFKLNIMKLSVISLIAIFLISALSQCNSSTSNDDSEQKDTIEVKQVLEEDKQLENAFDSNSVAYNEIILFANMDRFIRTKDNISVLKGINIPLMETILLKYIKNKHIDKNKKEENVADSVFVDLINSNFSFVRKTLSNLTAYDVARQRDNDADESLKNIKTYDRHIIKGKFTIIEVKLDIATIEFEGTINDLDAITYYYYGEEAPFNENKFTDNFQVDLMAAFNDLGRVKKLTKHDLEIVDNKKLNYSRNQFFARKAYIFKTKKMMNYFGKKEWYTPLYDEVSDSLSQIEKYNIELIKQLEEEVK